MRSPSVPHEDRHTVHPTSNVEQPTASEVLTLCLPAYEVGRSLNQLGFCMDGAWDVNPIPRLEEIFDALRNRVIQMSPSPAACNRLHAQIAESRRQLNAIISSNDFMDFSVKWSRDGRPVMAFNCQQQIDEIYSGLDGALHAEITNHSPLGWALALGRSIDRGLYPRHVSHSVREDEHTERDYLLWTVRGLQPGDYRLAPAWVSEVIEYWTKLRLPFPEPLMCFSCKPYDGGSRDTETVRYVESARSGTRADRCELVALLDKCAIEGFSQLASSTGGMANQAKQLGHPQARATPSIGSAPLAAPAITQTPRWDKSESPYRLLVGDVIVRTVRPNAFNIIRILDSFQELGWPREILDPLTGPREKQWSRMHEAIRSLNSGLSVIQFSGNGTSRGIRWDPV
jgi:hypothetical protein